VLLEAGHEVSVFDCISACPLPAEKQPDGIVRLGRGNDEVIRRVREFGPDLVGISCCYTVHSPQCYEIAALVKDEYSTEVPVIVGGPHASNSPEDPLSRPYIDYVAVGEGEGIISEVCEALESGGPVDGIRGLLRADGNGGLVGDPVRPRIEDLDSIPFPRRDLFPLENYTARQRSYPQDINNRRIPKTTMVTSRGCPGNCVFCASSCMWGRRWIPRSPENIVAEIESLVRDFGIRELDFLDDNISVSRERLLRICELIIAKGIDIKWTTPNGIAIWTLDHDLLRLMKKAGCYRLVFGLESGDPETIMFVRKRYSVEHVRDIIKFANHIGMWTVATFIVGFPYESDKHIKNTMDFASSLGLDIAMFYSVTPYPATDLYDVCIKEGIDTTLTPHKQVFDTLYLTADEVEEYRAMSTVQFTKSLMRKPWKPLEKIRSYDDLRFTARVVRYSLGMLLPSSEENILKKYPNFRR
jgi:anaerobic magnesium-protoporphyrin IX monomethyl ester cyclase